ncbi:hypothetical protein H6G74_01560 [Nostoc spongiaeforme FACHB-130]|uniref:Uncharacterized protein n=1 Tax=Nostoc spongiaeforme FACHB-130 TaxID=1357510 RepID=A0ABR8FPY9_9NOSO|nr:hypothetical protein [Nostoc spongiaeforme FACHB-130]
MWEGWEVWEDGEEIFPPTLPSLPTLPKFDTLTPNLNEYPLCVSLVGVKCFEACF